MLVTKWKDILKGEMIYMGEEVKKETRKYDMHLRITKTEFDELEIASYEKDMSKSDIVRKAIKMYISGLKGSY